jgi:polyisoprenoid-binding protein YceI
LTINHTVTRPDVLPGRYTIDPARSRISFRIKELWGLRTVYGTVRVLSGAVLVAADPARSSVRVTVDAASFTTGNRRRDRQVTGRGFLDVAEHAAMTFTGLRAERQPDGWYVPGTLRAHGVGVQVTPRLTDARRIPGGCAFTATLAVDPTWFGVSRAGGLIGDTVDVTVEVVATAAGA